MRFFRQKTELLLRTFCWLAIIFIRCYRRLVAPLLRRKGLTCLHYPTCSEYGLIAFNKYAFVRAFCLTWKRWRDCHPFSGRPYVDYP